MRFHAFSLVCSVLIVLSVSVVAAQSALPIDGTWEGAIAEKGTSRSRGVQQAQQSRVVIQVSTASDGRYGGKWLIASSGKPDIADIGEVTIDGDAVSIGLPTHGVWEGTLSSDGLTLAGELRQGGKTTPLVLRRTGNSNEPVKFDSLSPGTTTRR